MKDNAIKVYDGIVSAPKDLQSLFLRPSDYLEEPVFNSNKRKMCEVYINKKLYSVYEYDLRDLQDIEQLNKHSANQVNVILTMLKRAIPDCKEEDLETLTQSESQELLTMIQSSASLAKLQNFSTTVQ